MKQIIGAILILATVISFQKCANPGVVSGGPKDTIPPELISSYPIDQTLNFDDRVLKLVFSEPIAADKIKQNLIISPTTKNKFKHFIKKNEITIEFEESFNDTTTYTFNFFDAITDITEKNPPVNLILAFSTGDFIDSLRFYGTVKDLFTNNPSDKATVSLYAKTDTLDIYEEIPTYFSTSNKEGIFNINNIKFGYYKVISFIDKNRNLKFDEAEESYAFLAGHINPQQLTDSTHLFTYQIDASLLKLNSARINGNYYDMRYSKPISGYRIINTDSILTINSNIIDDQETVRFYNPFNGYPNDSIQVIIEVSDSLKNSSTDTTYIAFRESSRKKLEFTSQVSPSNGKSIEDNQIIQIKFSKPVRSWDLGNIYVNVDSLHSYYLDDVAINWNHNYTIARIQSVIDRNQLLDSILTWNENIVIDSLNPDSLMLKKKSLLSKYDKNTINIILGENTFISTENDSLSLIDLKYKFIESDQLGTVTVNVKSDSSKYFVQLIGKGNVIQEKYSCETCYFKDIMPGKYSIRVLIDSNQDSIWSVGNIRKDIPPEPIHHFPEETDIRSNFDMQLDIAL